jgi:hypothetical protein
MRPWAQWLIDHNLRFVLFPIPILCFPIYFISAIPEVISRWRADMKSIFTAPKTRKD